MSFSALFRRGNSQSSWKNRRCNKRLDSRKRKQRLEKSVSYFYVKNIIAVYSLEIKKLIENDVFF